MLAVISSFDFMLFLGSLVCVLSVECKAAMAHLVFVFQSLSSLASITNSSLHHFHDNYFRVTCHSSGLNNFST